MIEINYTWTEVCPQNPGYYWHKLSNDSPKLYFIGYPCRNNTHNIKKLYKTQRMAVCGAAERLTNRCVHPSKFLGFWQLAFTCAELD